MLRSPAPGAAAAGGGAARGAGGSGPSPRGGGGGGGPPDAPRGRPAASRRDAGGRGAGSHSPAARRGWSVAAAAARIAHRMAPTPSPETERVSVYAESWLREMQEKQAMVMELGELLMEEDAKSRAVIAEMQV